MLLQYSLKVLEILNQRRREQVNTIVIEHCNSILIHKSGPANKAYLSINQEKLWLNHWLAVEVKFGLLRERNKGDC